MADGNLSGRGELKQVGRVSELVSAEKRMKIQEATFFDLVERFGLTEELFHELRDALTEATVQVRVAEPGTTPRGWTYAARPDRPVRIAAARTIAQILGLIKSGQNTTVNNTSQTLNMGKGDTLETLSAVGVPRETIRAALRSLENSVTVSEEHDAGQAKSG